MMKPVVFCSALVLLILSGFSFVCADDEVMLQKVIAALEGPFRSTSGKTPAIRDFQVDFIQESEVVSLGQKQIASGRAVFMFLPPRQENLVSPLFRWEYVEPHHQQIVSDGVSVWVHIPENQQVILSDARQSLTGDENANPLAFLTNIDDLGRFFDIRWADESQNEAGNYRIELIPKKKSPLLDSLVLGVSRKALEKKGKKNSFPLDSIVLTNVNGDKSRIILTTPRLNSGLTAEDFLFVPPEGTDILTQEQFRRSFQ